MNTKQLKFCIAKYTIKKEKWESRNKSMQPIWQTKGLYLNKQILQIVKKKIINLIHKLQISNCMRGNPNIQHTWEMLSLLHGHGNANVSINEVQFFPNSPDQQKWKRINNQLLLERFWISQVSLYITGQRANCYNCPENNNLVIY